METLKLVRITHGLSQQEVADHLGVERSTYTRYETGVIQIDYEKLKKLSELYGVSVDYLLDVEPNRATSLSRKIPVLGTVPAGTPFDAVELVEEYIDLYPPFVKDGDYFGLVVKGDSMAPEIKNGDVVVVIKQQGISSGDIAVVRVNDSEVTVKKVVKTKTGIKLVPKNPSFDPAYFSEEEIRTLPVTIIGKVIEIRRRL